MSGCSSNIKMNFPFDIFNLTKSEFAEAVTCLGEREFRSRQMWRWIYCESIYNFSKMTDISKDSRELFAQNFKLELPKIANQLTSTDGTVKFLLELADGNKIETVYIPETKRTTICVSSQVGCALRCAFCHTGTQGFTRNLSVAEIVKQVVLVRNFAAKKSQENNEECKPINLVFMGMGEPFYNYDNVSKAIKILMDGDGLAISRRRITISTSGVVPQIKKCAEDLRINLAVSLHAPSNEVRNKIMPINKKYPIKTLMDCLRNYPLKPQRRHTIVIAVSPFVG